MITDSPIVDEIRRRREEISIEFNYDLRKYIEHLRQIEAENPDRVVDQVTVVASKLGTQSKPENAQ